MNKAFVREPDQTGNVYCPRCGALAVEVGAATLDHHLPGPARAALGQSGYFCPYARCDVAYFNLMETVVPVTELRQPVYPKDPAAPLCACFGLTMEDVAADVQSGTPTRIRALLAKAKSPAARCQTLAPSGQCCLTEIQRLYMRMCAQSGG